MKKIIYTLFLFPLFIFSQNVDVADDAVITIETGATMTVSGSLTTNTSGSLIIVTSRTESGSLLAVDAGNSQGKGITLRRSLDGNEEWTLIGVPVTGETVADVDDDLRTNNGKSAIGYFDPSSNNGEFVYYDTNDNTALVNGRGYTVSPSESGTIDFTGPMPSANVTYELEAMGAGVTYGKWNLIGNPYPSYLHMTDDGGEATNNFLTVNAAVIHDDFEAIYAWDGSEYDVYNQTTDNINYIAPGEGFFIYSVDGGGDAQFTEAMQTSGKGVNFNASIANGSSAQAQKRVSIFKLELKDNAKEQRDITKLYFSDEREVSKGLDPGYDAGKFFAGSESRIFTRLVDEDKGTDFHIQALPLSGLKDLVIPLGITTKSSSLELSVIENSLDDFYNVYLEDNLKNTIVELDRSIKLEFNQNENNDARFYLHFTDGIIPELPTDDNFRIFKVSEGEIKLMGDYDTRYKAQIFDFTGRLIKEVEFKHQTNVDRLGKGIQILKIKSDLNQGIITTKKFILN